MTPTTTPPPSTPPPPAPNARPRDDASQRRHRDDFERSLRARSGDDEASEPAPPDAMAALFGALLPMLPPAPKPDQEAASGIEGGGATKGALQTSLRMTPPAAPLADAATASAWEVTLRQPQSVAVDVKAVKADAAHGWSLAIGSPVVDASTLARHVPKLNERLQARAAHARIAGSDPQEQEQPR